MKKIELGNVYKLNTSKGAALLQLINLPEDKRNDVEMIKVSYNLFDSITEISDAIFDNGYFFIKFPVKAALRKKIIELVGFINLPDDFQAPYRFRTPHYFKNNHWIISNNIDDSFIEVEQLSNEQMLLSPDSTWNDTYLKERLEEGWRLENWK